MHSNADLSHSHVAMGVASGVAAPAEGPRAIAVPLVVLGIESHGQGLLLSWLRHSKVVLVRSSLHGFRVAMGVASGVAAPAEGPGAIAVPPGAEADTLCRIVGVGPRFHRSSATALGGVRAGCKAADVVQALAIAIPLVVLGIERHGQGLLLSWLRHSKVVLVLGILHGFRVAMGVASGVAAPAEGPGAIAVPPGAEADTLCRIVGVGPRFHRSSATALGGVRAGCEAADVVQALAVAIPLMVLGIESQV